jgi:hypothetical protein
MTEHLEMVVRAGALGWALYGGHHAGDYWVQTNWMAATKGCKGHEGRMACLAHVVTYLATQAASVGVLVLLTGVHVSLWAALAGLAISGGTHYAADRREFSLMFWLARKLGKAGFMSLGVPRKLVTDAQGANHAEPRGPVPLDNPSLGTGAWALDQAWHIWFGVFLTSVVMAALS